MASPRASEYGWAVMSADRPVLHAHLPRPDGGSSVCGQSNLLARGYSLVKIVNTSPRLQWCKRCWPHRKEQ